MLNAIKIMMLAEARDKPWYCWLQYSRLPIKIHLCNNFNEYLYGVLQLAIIANSPRPRSYITKWHWWSFQHLLAPKVVAACLRGRDWATNSVEAFCNDDFSKQFPLSLGDDES